MKTNIEIPFYEPWGIEYSAGSNIEYAKSGNGSKLITFYCNENANDFFESSVGIKINILDFSFTYDLGFEGYEHNYIYHTSDNSTFELGCGLDLTEGFIRLSNTNYDSYNSYKGTFNGIYALLAILGSNTSPSVPIPNTSPMPNQIPAFN